MINDARFHERIYGLKVSPHYQIINSFLVEDVQITYSLFVDDVPIFCGGKVHEWKDYNEI